MCNIGKTFKEAMLGSVIRHIRIHGIGLELACNRAHVGKYH